MNPIPTQGRSNLSDLETLAQLLRNPADIVTSDDVNRLRQLLTSTGRGCTCSPHCYATSPWRLSKSPNCTGGPVK